MKLPHFSTLAGAFAAGLVLSGCASAPQEQAYMERHQANAAPAFVQVRGPDGRGYVVPGEQTRHDAQGDYFANGQSGYQSAYARVTPRYPYGYDTPRAAQQREQRALAGLVVGAAVGNAASHGNSRAIAGGAVLGQAIARQGDPCREANVGTVLGAVAGYALGNKIGGGNGRKAASVLGAIGGANLGGDAARPGPRCR